MKYPVVGLARALALWGTPSHDAGRRARSRCAPREGEGRRREGGVERSERYLDGRATMGKRAEVEHPHMQRVGRRRSYIRRPVRKIA